MGREGGTHSASAQCSGEQITRGNTKRCDSGLTLNFTKCYACICVTKCLTLFIESSAVNLSCVMLSNVSHAIKCELSNVSQSEPEITVGTLRFKARRQKQNKTLAKMSEKSEFIHTIEAISANPTGVGAVSVGTLLATSQAREKNKYNYLRMEGL